MLAAHPPRMLARQLWAWVHSVKGAAALLHNRSPLPQCAHYRTHTSDPLSLDTTDQWATHRLLLTEAPASARQPQHPAGAA